MFPGSNPGVSLHKEQIEFWTTPSQVQNKDQVGLKSIVGDPGWVLTLLECFRKQLSECFLPFHSMGMKLE